MKFYASAGIFGVPTDLSTAKVAILPVPWDVTTSYGGGTSQGPKAIMTASPQIDLYDVELGEAYKAGYHLCDEDPFFLNTNERLRATAKIVIDQWNEHGEVDAQGKNLTREVNAGTTEMVDRVKSASRKILDEGKIPAVLGGDHSTPLGLIAAIAEKTGGNFGILHIDAHADLRNAYHGFVHSHASIMNNVMSLAPGPKKLVQVGIRDFCKEEVDFMKSKADRIRCFFDDEIKKSMFRGSTWQAVCEDIIKELPQNVYISFDIDGLSPDFCPHTGTPVPGGLHFDQAVHLLSVLGKSGRKIVGFDLNEVAPGSDTEWDGNVGARMLFKLCGWAARTNGHA
jgi:agmatinase